MVVYAALAAMFVYLFYNEVIGEFPSDMPAHMRTALSDEETGYSLIYPFLVMSNSIAGAFGVAVFLTVLQMATMVISEVMMRRLMPEVRAEIVFVLALVANFVMAIYLPVLHPHFSHGLSVGNAWHNSTYLGMKLLGLVAIWMYLRFVGALESRNKVVDWIVFTACVVASAAVKPSFVVAFGPTVVILCVIDLVKNGTGTLKRSFALAVPFVIVLGVLFYQYTLLYVEDTSSGIGFGIARVWRHRHFFFPLGMLQSYAFPFLVFIFCWKKFKGDFNYRMTIILFAIALAIWLFVNETGTRTYHGNFAWSCKFAVYYLFISSIAVYFREYGAKFPLILKAPAVANTAAIGTPGEVVTSEDSGQSLTTETPNLPVQDEAGIAPAGAPDLPASGEAVGTARNRPAFWPELFTLAVLGLHVASGIGAMVKILSGHGYG